MFIATLIAARRLPSGDISAAEDALRAAGIEPMGRSWVEADEACDLLFSADPATARRALEGLLAGVDVVVQGETGLLAPAEDSRALADAIAGLVADPARRRKMGESGRQRVLEHFAVRAMVDQTVAVYRRALGAPRTR